MKVGWIAASSGKVRSISASANNITLSSYFSESEWKSAATKTIVIDSGVTIGSTSSSVSALSTGTTVGASALGGKLKLINNGFIYGAGGSAEATGGTAFQADIPVIVTNNSNIYAGGGGGGAGGRGGGGYWWPEDKTEKYSLLTTPQAYWGTWYAGLFTLYEIGGASHSHTDPSLILTSYDSGSYRYYQGAGPFLWFSASYWKIRRRTIGALQGGAGGSGGRGQGSDNLTADAGTAGQVGSTSTGGTGGGGGNWGATASTGATGGAINTAYTDQTVAPVAGAGGGLGGYYIDGDSNVTWNTTGNRLGRVTG